MWKFRDVVCALSPGLTVGYPPCNPAYYRNDFVCPPPLKYMRLHYQPLKILAPPVTDWAYRLPAQGDSRLLFFSPGPSCELRLKGTAWTGEAPVDSRIGHPAHRQAVPWPTLPLRPCGSAPLSSNRTPAYQAGSTLVPAAIAPDM